MSLAWAEAVHRRGSLPRDAATYRQRIRRSWTSNRREKYLRLTPRVRSPDEVAAFVDGAVGQAEQPLEVGRRVFDAIVELLSYDKTIPGCGTGDTAWIMKHKRGKCDDYHALFMAAMISRRDSSSVGTGISPGPPNRRGTLQSCGRLSGDCSGAHCWASFYDPSHGLGAGGRLGGRQDRREGGDFYFGQLSPNRFQVSEGRRIVLNPAQGGDPSVYLRLCLRGGRRNPSDLWRQLRKHHQVHDNRHGELLI